MNFFRRHIAESPLFARVAPLVAFVILTYFQDKFGEVPRYWIYFAKTIVGAWFIWVMRPYVAEMRWNFSFEAVLVGIGVFAIWILLGDLKYLRFSYHGLNWNPNAEFGDGSPHAWLFIVLRILGMTFVVPPLEEVFYRSFVYRFLVQKNFLELPLNQFYRWPFFVTALVFGFTHFQWFAGILAGLAYQWLVLRKGRLGDAITAHAITNFLLGLWVVWKGDWQFM